MRHGAMDPGCAAAGLWHKALDDHALVDGNRLHEEIVRIHPLHARICDRGIQEFDDLWRRFLGEKDERLWELALQSFLELEKGVFVAETYQQFVRQFESKFLAVMGYEGDTSLAVLGKLVPPPL